MDNVTEIASALIFTQDFRNIIKETYSENLIYEIDREDIK